MESDVEILFSSQRIRYEAFSKFATEINKCISYEDISRVLTSQIKFLFECFIFRVYYQSHISDLVFQGFHGKSVFFQNGDDIIYDFEREIIQKGVPVNCTLNDESFNYLIDDTIFGHHGVVSLSSLPIHYPFGGEFLITIASKDPVKYIELDFKFLKLVGDLLSNKLAQLILLEDIARQKKELEVKNKQITSLNNYLQSEVSQRSIELLEANQELSTLFYKTSHDFRAPLANIMGLANLAELITNDEEVLGLFERCRKVVHGMDNMLVKLDDLTSLDNDKTFELLDLKSLLLQVKDKFQSRLDACGGRLVIKADGLKPFRSNAGIMYAVFEQMLDNAIVFCKEDLLISITVKQTDDTVEITVKDNGQGITPVAVPKIFDMYYRGNANSKGNGLGLYIVKKLLKRLNGEICVDTAHGQFTMFHLKLRL